MWSDLPVGWDQARLGDLADQGGLTYGVVKPGDFVENGVPLVRVTDFADGRVRGESLVRIDPAVSRRHRRSVLQGGEVLVTLVGTVGLVAVAGRDLVGANVARAVAVIPLRDPQVAAWCAAVLRGDAVRRYFADRLNTTVQATLNLRDLAEVLIPLPPQREMDAITVTLNTFCEKRISNARKAQMLARIVAAAFRQRFGADWPAASRLGHVPAGMSWGTVGDLIEVHYGKALKASDRVPGPAAVVGSSGVVGSHRRGLTRGPAVVIGRKGIVGSVIWVDRDAWPIDTTFFAVPLRGIPMTWVYEALRSARLHEAQGDSAVPGLNRNAALARPAVIPTQAQAQEFDALARPLLKSRTYALAESEALRAVYDALLPKLVSGQIRVPLSNDPEEQVGAAVEALLRS